MGLFDGPVFHIPGFSSPLLQFDDPRSVPFLKTQTGLFLLLSFLLPLSRLLVSVHFTGLTPYPVHWSTTEDPGPSVFPSAP